MSDVADLLESLLSNRSFDPSFYVDITTTQHLLIRDDTAWSRLTLELRLAFESAQAGRGVPANVAALMRHALHVIECQPHVFGLVEGIFRPRILMSSLKTAAVIITLVGRVTDAIPYTELSIHRPLSMASGTGINVHCRRIPCSA